MIVTEAEQDCQTALDKPVDAFLVLKPIVERHAGFAFRHLVSSDREEAIAEAVAAAFQAFVSLTHRGKDPMEFPSMVAIRAVQHVQNERRVAAGSTNVTPSRKRRDHERAFNSGDLNK